MASTHPHDAASAPDGYRGRFAPSPTGPLHMGSLVAALGSWLLARHAGGAWLLRIEDIDPPREVAGAADAQLAALAAFGLHGDGPVMRQSQRDVPYQEALDALLATGAAFACHCSRSDLASSGGIHRLCVARAPRSGQVQPAIRLRVADGAVVRFDDLIQGPQQQDVAGVVGDFVLRRADGYWAYQLAVVVDDAAQRITDVVRGADLLGSTARQILLQRALGLPTPRYAHLPLVLDAHGRKLSKSDAAQPVDPDQPVAALRTAWQLIGQDASALAEAGDADALLACALAAFKPQAIPPGQPPADIAAQRRTFMIGD
ncbi:tRNA glutamyl-Q(34) synthetase GluQRS [Montanilutibacter psychrotolerans]|uniref:Glutamyl-Q tRNA(Asp) synthetase n=1 Tax=Montanilutibacter psychrotolerans TaxID=1327343 RepID=A0A3M8T023_9GAMM|nr:tRNA glutamyl-Q(34) synthetase GluQRS [Lysobacter psychrotolerans]RNF85036.1 tRNA glutamyl-Q(34) synthetase GluQRS [Lysobacter psychrotolerans]